MHKTRSQCDRFGFLGSRVPKSLPLFAVSCLVVGGTATIITQRVRQWRNWQTHQLEGLTVAIPWRFESSLPHQTNPLVTQKQAGDP